MQTTARRLLGVLLLLALTISFVSALPAPEPKRNKPAKPPKAPKQKKSKGGEEEEPLDDTTKYGVTTAGNICVKDGGWQGFVSNVNQHGLVGGALCF